MKTCKNLKETLFCFYIKKQISLVKLKHILNNKLHKITTLRTLHIYCPASALFSLFVQNLLITNLN